MNRLNAHNCRFVWTAIQSCLELDFHLDLEKRDAGEKHYCSFNCFGRKTFIKQSPTEGDSCALLDLFACTRMRVVQDDQVPASEEEDEETLLVGTPRTGMKMPSTPFSRAL